MTQFDKALARLLERPKDFTWRELQTVMNRFGYHEKKGSGSRRKFVHHSTNAKIILHEPHPQPIMKKYALDLVITHLQNHKLI